MTSDAGALLPDTSSPPCLLRSLPAGAVAGWGLHPLEKRRLVAAHVDSGHLLAVLTALCQLARGGREVDEPVPFVNHVVRGPHDRSEERRGGKGRRCWCYGTEY